MVSRSELATRLSRDGATHAEAVHAVDAVLHEITAALVAGERVALTGFGTFEPVARPARTARNPRTGSAVEVPAATVARFRPGAQLRGALHSGDAGTVPAGRLPAAGHAVAAAAGAGDPAVAQPTREGSSAGSVAITSVGAGEPESKAGSKSKTGSKATTASKSKSKTGPRSKAEAKTKPKTKPKTKAKAEAKAKAKAKARGGKKSPKGKR